MVICRVSSWTVAAFFVLGPWTASAASTAASNRCASVVQSEVAAAASKLMATYDIPGMAVGVLACGRSRVFNYGVESTTTQIAVSAGTLFEIGSISKTFTATLAAYAQVNGKLSLSDKVGKFLPSLRDSSFGSVSLLHLATYTLGGLPLQVPDAIASSEQLMEYLQAWHPTYTPGTHRTYSNISIGVLGLIAAKSMGADFATLMEQRLLPGLQMRNTYINVPAQKMQRYAQGYAQDGTPVRLTPAVLWSQAYGIKTTAADMLRFLAANMGLVKSSPSLQRAMTDTHTGYFQTAAMTQDLVWEQLPYPVALQSLLVASAPAMIFEPQPVSALQPAQKPRQDVWINKTGSTNGFGAYVAFVPQKQLAIVILANKSYPIAARVTAAFAILQAVGQGVQ